MPLRVNPHSAVSIIMFCVAVSGSAADDRDPSSPNRFVDPFVSTGGNRYVCGHNSPAATVPFGLVRLSPDTVSSNGRTATNTSGYYYHDPLILGFSHTRLCGTGAVDGGHLRVMPCANGTPLKELRRGMRAEVDHDNESASPGYYSVTLPKIGLKAELTATRRVGLHRYSFEAGTTPRILIDVGSVLGRGRSEACEVQVNPASREVTGTTRTFGSFSGRYGGLQVYFVAHFRRPWESFTTWSGDSVAAERAQGGPGTTLVWKSRLPKTETSSRSNWLLRSRMSALRMPEKI